MISSFPDKSSKNPLTILLVMPLFTGLKPLFLKGEKAIGMPAVYNLLEGLARSDHDVHLALFLDSENLKEFSDFEKSCEIFSKIKIYRFRFPLYNFFDRLIRGKEKKEFSLGLSRLFKLPLKIYGLSRKYFTGIKIAKLIGKINPDIIYGAMDFSLEVALLGKLFHIPTIGRFYGILYFYPNLSKIQKLTNLNTILSFVCPCDYILMTNDGTRGDEVLRYYRVPEHSVRFWINGVNKSIYQESFNRTGFLRKYNVSPEDKLVLIVSRLVNWKRVDRTIKAIPNVMKKCKNAKFLILGDGPERNNLESLAESLSIKKYTRFMGFVTHEEVYQFMNAADIFVSLYDVSNLCNPLLEAMVCGKCVISLEDGSLRGIIQNGETGILLNHQSVSEYLPVVLIDLLENNGKRYEIGQKARAFALKNFDTWEERIKKEIQLIEETARKRLESKVSLHHVT